MTPPPRALVFDLDDLLVRSAPIWRRAEEALLAALGQAWSADLARRYKGMNALDVARTIHEAYRPAQSLVDCQQLMRDTLIDGFAHGVEPMPGATTIVRRFHGLLPLAVASGSPLVAIDGALQALGISDCFAVRLSSESVARGKPHPDVFLAAARALGVAPADCLVFEDSLIGVQAARAAGMRCCVVPSGDPALVAPLADRVCASLAEVAVAEVGGGRGPLKDRRLFLSGGARSRGIPSPGGSSSISVSPSRRSSPPPEGCRVREAGRVEGRYWASGSDRPSPSPSQRPLGATPPVEGTSAPRQHGPRHQG